MTETIRSRDVAEVDLQHHIRRAHAAAMLARIRCEQLSEPARAAKLRALGDTLNALITEAEAIGA